VPADEPAKPIPDPPRPFNGRSAAMERSSNPNIWIERELVKSLAFGKLTGAAPRVLLVFFTKRQMVSIKVGKREVWDCANNGALEFTYDEARDRYKLTDHRFTRALDQLITCGFLDVEHAGGQLQRDKSLYRLSDRWRAFDRADFEEKRRPKGRRWPRRR